MLAYLFSRYPVVSQTFCDSEMLALEAAGTHLVVGSLNPPPDSFRHARLDQLRAEILYPPPPAVLGALPEAYPEDWAALRPLIAEHDRRYGPSFKSGTRARNALAFAPAFRRRGVRHIHVHFANRATHTALFLAKLGFTFSFTAHAKDFMVDLGSDALLQEMAAAATAVIAVSDFSRDLLAEACPDSAGKVARVYNGIDPATFPAAHPAGRAPSDPLRIISVGRLLGMKGFGDLIDACAVLRDRGVPTILEIVGSGPKMAELRERAAAFGIADSVSFLGSRGQEEIKERLAAAHVFALACRREADGGTDILPTVIMEAMAAGLPVVSTNFVGIPEMVVAGKTGFLVPPDSPTQLADALARLAEDPVLGATLGQAGRALGEERFSLAVTTPQLASRFPPSGSPGPPRAHPSLAYLVGSPPREPALAHEIALAQAHPGTWVIALGAAEHTEPSDAALEFLPDGVVLEASWRRASDRWPEIDALRAKLGTAFGGEDFYRDARRAVYLIAPLRARGIGAVHAARSGEIVLAWLLARLGGFRATFTAERGPALARSLIEKLAPDFADASVSDDRLAERLGGRFPDALELGSKNAPAGRAFFRRTKKPPAASSSPTTSGVEGWLDRLLNPLPPTPPAP